MKYQKVIILTLIGIIAFPSMAFASWWNPFSWFKPRKQNAQPVTQVITSSNTVTPNVELVSEKKSVPEEKKKEEIVKNNTVEKKTEQPVKPVVKNNPVTITTPPVNMPVQKLDPQLLTVAQQILNNEDEAISTIKDIYEQKYEIVSKQRKLCTDKYNNNASKAKSDAQYYKTTFRSGGSGGLMATGPSNEIDKALEYDLETYRMQKEDCLDTYSLPDSSVTSRLNKLTSRVSSLRSNIHTPEDAVKYQNELQALHNDIMAVGNSLKY